MPPSPLPALSPRGLWQAGRLGLGAGQGSCFSPVVSLAASLIAYLKQLEQNGQQFVRLDEEAKEVLRSWLRAGRSKGPRQVRSQGGQASRQAGDCTVAETEPCTRPPALPALRIEGSSPGEKLASLQEQAESWEPARSLGSLRDSMVFAVGNPEADLMLVGEAPGYEEERHREPFVGRAGQKLDQILTAMGLARQDVYISNICKFRPALRNQTTNNRKPTPEEMDCCLPFVRAEISIVRPKCIVALGGTAAEGLLNYQNKPVGRMRGDWHDFEGIPLRVTYHPSYLLHNDSAISEKRKVWEDMLSVLEFLGLPITEKQRGFFA